LIVVISLFQVKTDYMKEQQEEDGQNGPATSMASQMLRQGRQQPM
jgi:hypothetical protein